MEERINNKMISTLLHSSDGDKVPVNRARVLFATEILEDYRVPFHEGVRRDLARFGVSYDLIFGQATTNENYKTRSASLPWGKEVVNRHLGLGRYSALWQPILSEAWASDLVVIGQESRFLANYLIQAARRFQRPKVALWGHGKNFQGKGAATRVAARWKRLWATQCDWWFAYTETSRKIVEGYGFPSQRITVFHNAIDTTEIRRLTAQISDQRLETLRQQFGIGSRNVGVYVGGLYDHKRIEFLIETAKEIQHQVPDFRLLVVGDGVDRRLVESAAAQFPWIRYFGPLFGDQKAEILRLGRVFMMPGLVGLAVLDCAAAGLPIVTTAYPYHSPEIAYIEPGRNGLVVADWLNPQAYAGAVVAVLREDKLYASLVRGAGVTAEKLTIERMVNCFSEGVLAALDAPKWL
jgi:glycosyltransferase involved in cell wall biosynthesis